MPSSSRSRKSSSTPGKENGPSSGQAPGAEPLAHSPVDAEIAPEGVAPDPALLVAPAPVAHGTIAIKKRAPIPGRTAKPASTEAAHTLTVSPDEILIEPSALLSLETFDPASPETLSSTQTDGAPPDSVPLPTRNRRGRKKGKAPEESATQPIVEEAVVAEIVEAVVAEPVVADTVTVEPAVEVAGEPEAIIMPSEEVEFGPEQKEELRPVAKTGLWATFTRLRAGWGWVLGLAALGVAFYGQKLASDARALGAPDPPILSWVMFGVAGLIFVLGIAPWPTMVTRKTTAFFATLRSMPRGRRWFFSFLFWGGVLLGLASLPLFWTLNTNLPEAEINTGWLTNTGNWLLWIAALFLFAFAWVVWERSVPETSTKEEGSAKREARNANDASGPPSQVQDPQSSQLSVVSRQSSTLPARWHWAIIGGLFVFAVLLRFVNLENAPPGLWFDEAEEGLLAQRLLAPDAVHHTFLAGFYTMGTIYLYLLGIMIKLFGAEIWQLRFLPAIGGSLMIPMLYVLGTRLYNWRVGLLAGGLLAVSAWHITFSRFGILSMFTFALDLGVYLCVVQGLRTGRFGYYAGAGVLMGIALQSYLASQVVPLVLVTVLAYRLVTERLRFFRAVRAGLVVFAISAMVTAIPLGTFALQHPETFTSRASAVTIFSPTGSEGRTDALAESIRRHLYMFNYRGDANPRHNLPGEPMLDWLTAALFFSGLAACVLRIWRWQYLFPVVWFGASLSGGVLSLLFEAPQSHRTLENSVVSALVAGIFLGGVWTALDGRAAAAWTWWRDRQQRVSAAPTSELRRGLRSVPHFAIAAVILAGPVWSGFYNTDRYFNKQMNDMSVWLEMGGTNRALGELLRTFGDDYSVYISPDRASTPASRFLAPDKQPEVWPGGHILPFIEERNVAVLFGTSDEADVLVIKRLYPNAQVNIIYGPSGQDPQLYNIVISPEDIRSVRGTQTIDASYSAATLKIDQYASYRFGWADAGAAPQLLVDGYEVLMGGSVNLGTGLHSVVLSGTQGTSADFNRLRMGKGDEQLGAISSALLFDPRKVEPRGLTAYVRQDNTFQGEPKLVRIDSQVSFYFHLIPLNRPYTVEWVGKLYAPVAGTYTFHTEQLSMSRLFIDGVEVLFNGQPNIVQSASTNLTVGLHDIRLEYQDLDGFSHMYLYWTPPTLGERYIIPTDFLLPVMAKYPDLPASGAWPNLDQTDDTRWTLANQAAEVAEPQPTPPPGQEAVEQPTTQPPPTPAFAGDRLAPSLVLGTVGTNVLPRPRAAAVDPEGNIYIYTEDDSMIRKFSGTGEKLAEWVPVNVEGQPIKEGSAMMVRDGKLLFLDSAPAEIIVYGLGGTVETRARACDCYFPRGMAPSNDGNLWVTDTGFNHIFKVNLEGTTLATLGERGTGPGELIEPSSVWESPQGNLFVTDAGNRRVQSFTPEGQPVAQWGMGEGTARDGNRVTGTSEGNVLLTQYDGRAVIEYGLEGDEKARWVYEQGGRALIPAGISPAGGGKYIVLYTFDNIAAIFDLGR